MKQHFRRRRQQTALRVAAGERLPLLACATSRDKLHVTTVNGAVARALEGRLNRVQWLSSHDDVMVRTGKFLNSPARLPSIVQISQLMNTLRILTCAASVSLISTAGAAGVSVGASSLIGQLDYSDSFTLGTGTRTTLAPNAYPIGGSVPAALAVENNHGNPAMTWTDALWSISNDASAINGGTVYPGGSGAGSATGMTQTGGGEINSGIEYNLRDDFVVQFDAVSVADRVNLTIGNTRDGIAGTNGLSIFFRVDGHATLPEIGIYNPNVGEVITSLDTGLAGMGLNQWHNYAARFNGNTGVITLWVDQIELGSVNLITFGGPTVFGGPVAPAGAFLPFITAASNDSISIGSTGGDRTWMDNFQVGAPIPEPASVTLAGLAGLALLRRRRAI